MQRLSAKHRIDPTKVLKRSLGRMAESEENDEDFSDAYEIFELCLGMCSAIFQKQLLQQHKLAILRREVEQDQMDALLRLQLIRRS